MSLIFDNYRKRKDMKIITTYVFVKLSNKLFVHGHDKPENNNQNRENK